ncbi:hypothetical protein BDL97_13G020500 [Sphagnum fallax]|nr:hypothetical protein BDL97_13G020500 [Sphagnum fallax]
MLEHAITNHFLMQFYCQSLQQWRFIHLQQCNLMKYLYNLQGQCNYQVPTLGFGNWLLGFCWRFNEP